MYWYLKESKSESNLIMLKIYDRQFKGGRFAYSTGERILAKDWTGTRGRGAKYAALNKRLSDIETEANDYILANRSTLNSVSLKEHLDKLRPIAVAIPESEKKKTTIISLWGQFLESVRGTLAPRTNNSYKNSFEAMKDFLTSERLLSLEPEKFTIVHLKKYQGYLMAKHMPNTVAKRIKHLKAFFLHLQELKIYTAVDLSKITYRESPGVKIFLNEEELAAMATAELDTRLSRIRDLFLLQCNTGLRVSDLMRVDQNVKGNKIQLEARKNKKIVEVIITPTTRYILEKYNYSLPKISDQKYNEGIKELYKKLFPENTIQLREGTGFKKVFVHELISSHDAIRTFITLSAERGMSVAAIAKITGKTVTILLRNYLVESQKNADKEMEKAWGSAPLRIAK